MASKKEKKKEEKKLSWKQNLVLYFHDLIYYVMTIVLLFLLLFRVIVVSGDSMYSTLWDGDYLLLLSNTVYHEPKQGDIVVVSKESFDGGAPIVKRVIATEGQTVDIDFENGIVYVDGVALDEPYIHNPTTTSRELHYPMVVQENCIFAMGDNRQVSKDSRSPEIGQIDKREVLGKALVLMIPGDNHGENAPDFDRLGGIQ